MRRSIDSFRPNGALSFFPPLGQADSGWRKVDERRVKQLYDTFMAGDYGLNILRKPSLVKFAHEENTAMCGDGRSRLADGKHTFTAMGRILAAFKADRDSEEPQVEWSVPLVDALENGVDVMIVEYTDEDHIQLHNVAAHDADHNKFCPTSMRDLCETAWKHQKKVPGGDWKATQKLLDDAYGNKRVWVYRMVRAAQCISEKSLGALAEYNIPNNWIHENPHFVGTPSERQKLLSPDT